MTRLQVSVSMLSLMIALSSISCTDKGTDSSFPPPLAARNPDPADSAIAQPVIPRLTWTYEPRSDNDSVTFNVYFSSEPSPGLAASGLMEAAFSPGALQYNTLYYWKVQACDRYGGKTTGPLWRFTTSATNQAPYSPTAPSPSHDAVNQLLSLLLTWHAGDPDGDQLQYDVYFGVEENPPLVATGLHQASHAVSGLEYHTIYYWRIVSHDDDDHETSGPIWMFTTLHTVGHIIPVGSYYSPGVYAAVCASGSNVYVGNQDSYFLVLDASDPEHPSLAAELDEVFSARDVFVSGDYAYATKWGTGLQIIDVSDPSHPDVAAATQEGGNAVCVQGSYAYCPLDGLRIVNVSDAYHPTLTGTYAYSHSGMRIEVQNDYAFSLDVVGFLVFDVHNKSAPTLIGQYRDTNYDTRLRGAAGIDVSGDYAYVVGVEERARFRIVDISDPASPTMVSYSDIVGGQAIEVAGDYAFVADGRALFALDISDINTPVIVGAYDVPSDITDLSVAGSHIFAGTHSSGLIILQFVP